MTKLFDFQWSKMCDLCEQRKEKFKKFPDDFGLCMMMIRIIRQWRVQVLYHS